jgi:agmatinase
VVVLPVPFERTTSYGKGTSAGPAALLRASQSMELYDDELGCEPCEIGIATAPPFHPKAFDMEEAMAELDAECHRFMESGKFLVTVGGEHSLTIAPVRAAQRVFGAGGGIGIVQFDAHADLREEFEGTPYSHASVMRRVFDEGIPSLPVGIRSLSSPEAELVARHKIPVLWGRELEPAAALERRFEAALKKLPRKVYLTFDIDYFDPSIVPATGTPEPGGGSSGTRPCACCARSLRPRRSWRWTSSSWRPSAASRRRTSSPRSSPISASATSTSTARPRPGARDRSADPGTLRQGGKPALARTARACSR